MRLADLYYSVGNYHKSASYFEKIIADEKNLDVKFQYAESLIHSNNFKRAIEMLDEIEVEIGKSPNLSLTKHDLYMGLENKEAAKKELQDLIDDNPSSIENKLVIADYFLRTNQDEAAEDMLKAIISENPKNGEVYIMMADINLRKDDLDASFINLEKGFAFDDVSMIQKIDLIRSLQPYAFEKTPDAAKIEAGLTKLFGLIYDEKLQNDTLHLAYGYFLRDQGKTDKAIEQLKLVTSINPDSYNAWLQLMYMQYDSDNYKGMYADAEQAVELFPAQPVVYLMAGIAAYEQKNYEESEEWLFMGKGLVITDPSLQAEFLHQIGKLYGRQKDFKQAHSYLDQAKKMDAFNGNVYATRAFIYLDEGKKDQAITEMKIGLKESPNSAFFLDAMGKLYLKMSEFAEAKTYFDRALKLEPKNGEIVEHMGDVEFNLGNPDKALEQWSKARELGRYNILLEKKITEKKYYVE